MTKERRVHCHLRDMVDAACDGVMPHIAKRIKDAARQAYYLGALDGMKLQQGEPERRKAS